MHATHESHPGKYIAVFVGLALLTAIEVLMATGAGLAATPLILILIALAAVKAGMVALFFMHLRDDTKWFALLFMYPFLLAGLLIFWTVFPA